MQISLAINTMKAFEQAVAADQGAAFRQWQKRVLPTLEDAYRGHDEPFRSHLGASVIGKECGRAIWYGFHWATKPHFEGRMMRLFNTGHLEEGRFISLLLTIGCTVYQQDENGKQFRISDFGGHFGGSGDGVAINLPDIPAGQPAITEFKTHNDKSFAKIAGTSWAKFWDGVMDPKKPQVAFDGEGVRSAKFEHWIQMQVYMRKMGLASAVYFAKNKNDEHIYAEVVHLDTIAADQMIGRAGEIIRMHDTPPPMINKSPGAFQCKFCDHKPVCKLGAEVSRNCRTCMYSEPVMEGETAGYWRCSNPVCTDGGQYESILSKEQQLEGCSHYERKRTM